MKERFLVWVICNFKIIFNKESDFVVGGVFLKMKLLFLVGVVNYIGCFDGF